MQQIISIHALLAESDGTDISGYLAESDFNPRSPCGERPLWSGIISRWGNFNPRSPCGERPGCARRACCLQGISIHALLAESDITAQMVQKWIKDISIHALLAESDPPYLPTRGVWRKFQSTLSLRRATGHRGTSFLSGCYFNPRSPCGERHLLANYLDNQEEFQSTLSLRRATANTTKLALSFLSKVPI